MNWDLKKFYFSLNNQLLIGEFDKQNSTVSKVETNFYSELGSIVGVLRIENQNKYLIVCYQGITFVVMGPGSGEVDPLEEIKYPKHFLASTSKLSPDSRYVAIAGFN